MAAKIIAVSADDITYYTLPGSTGEMSIEGAAIDDTIFGQSYRSNMTGIIGWTLNANAVYKGYPGYLAKLKKQGTSTAFTAEAMTLVSGKTYQITAATKRIWDRAGGAFVVKDGATDHTADVENIDYLFGKVTFTAAYTVTGAVTVDGFYYPVIDLAKATAYTLTQQANAIRDTHFPAAAANGGFNTHRPGLRTVALELPAVFDSVDAWRGVLTGREEIIVEINPDAQDFSVARGFFRLITDRIAGNVGELEEETLNFSLNVPMATGTETDIAVPFSWSHASNTPIPNAIRKILDAWLAEEKIHVKYLPEGGTVGVKGMGVISNFTLSGGMETMNIFALTITGDGGLTTLP